MTVLLGFISFSRENLFHHLFTMKCNCWALFRETPWLKGKHAFSMEIDSFVFMERWLVTLDQALKYLWCKESGCNKELESEGSAVVSCSTVKFPQ